MSIFFRIVRDLWNTALFTWLILVLIELSQPGWVQRIINLEYWFYGLFFSCLIFLLLKRGRIS